MTNKLIKERIMNVDLKFSRFTEDAKDFVSKLLTKNEDDRLGCGENNFTHIKNHPWFGSLDWDKVALRQEMFEGQEELMKSHAKEYKTTDIFDTYMNTIEVLVDTPASVKSSTSELGDSGEDRRGPGADDRGLAQARRVPPPRAPAC